MPECTKDEAKVEAEAEAESEIQAEDDTTERSGQAEGDMTYNSGGKNTADRAHGYNIVEDFGICLEGR